MNKKNKIIYNNRMRNKLANIELNLLLLFKIISQLYFKMN